MQSKFTSENLATSYVPEDLDYIDVIGKGGQGQVILCADSLNND